jgi:hypothetical protein
MAEPDPTQRPGAVRLIFEYEGDEVRLVSQQRVDVAVPGFDIALAPHPGHFLEVRDSGNLPLSRVPLREAFPTSAEVFPEEHGEPIVRVELPERRGAFTVVVPAREAADRVALVEVRPPARGGVPLGAAALEEPEVVELASFQLEPDEGGPR